MVDIHALHGQINRVMTVIHTAIRPSIAYLVFICSSLYIYWGQHCLDNRLQNLSNAEDASVYAKVYMQRVNYYPWSDAAVAGRY